MAQAIEVVLFDVGGVLVELTGVSEFLGWLNHRVTAEELTAEWLASPIVRAFETGQSSPETFADQLIEAMRLPVDRATFLAKFALWPRVFPRAVETVERVSRRYRRATLCNTNELQWTRMMDGMGLRRVFDHHFASHLIGKLKPDRAVFEHVVDALNCAPSVILFLDDSSANVESARQFGMQSVRVQGAEEAARALQAWGVFEPPVAPRA